MPEIMVLKGYATFGFYSLSMKFHRINCLNFPIRQTVYKFRRRNPAAVQVLYYLLILFPQGSLVNFVLFPFFRQFLKISSTTNFTCSGFSS